MSSEEMNKPQIELENVHSYRPDHSQQSSTDSDSPEQPLEVTFAAASISRRKASLSNADLNSSSRPKRPATPRQRTSLRIHGFLEDSRLHHSKSANDEESSTQSHGSPMDKTSPPHKTPTSSQTHLQPSNRNASHNHLTEVLEDPSVQSRLLTKKELSDMAFSIRELSKRLSHFKLRLKVHNVFLLTKAHDEELIGYTREVAAWLLSKDSGDPHTVYVEDTLQNNKRFKADSIAQSDNVQKGSSLKFWNNELCRKNPNAFDVVLALGGDGTVLYASWLFQRIVPPVLSFALGSLGFLTKFDFESYRTTLGQAFGEGLTVSVRLRLEATVMRAQKGISDGEEKQEKQEKNEGDEGDDDEKEVEEKKMPDLIEELIGEEADDMQTHRPEQSYNILNDVVMDRGPNATMSSIEVFGDGFHITTVQADGVCVATPTGSTAYNLAAGGSLCHPDNPVVLVTAICAHTLSFRPILLPDTIVLRLGVPYDARTRPWVSFDGKSRVELGPGDYVTISASRYPFPTVLPIGRGSEDWIDSLSRTLNWNSRQRQKAFSG